MLDPRAVREACDRWLSAAQEFLDVSPPLIRDEMEHAEHDYYEAKLARAARMLNSLQRPTRDWTDLAEEVSFDDEPAVDLRDPTPESFSVVMALRDRFASGKPSGKTDPPDVAAGEKPDDVRRLHDAMALADPNVTTRKSLAEKCFGGKYESALRRERDYKDDRPDGW